MTRTHVAPVQDLIESLELVNKKAFTTSLAIKHADRDFTMFYDLLGQPSPAARGQGLRFTPTHSALRGSLLDPTTGLRDGGPGALVEALVDGSEAQPTLHLRWFGTQGEVTLTLERCEVVSVTGDDEEQATLRLDNKKEIKRRQRLSNQVRTALSHWAPNFSSSPEERRPYVDDCDDDLIPLERMLESPSYGPVLHTPADAVENVILTEVAKLAQLHHKIFPCEHMQIPHLFMHITTQLIPRTRVTQNRPAPGETYFCDLAEHCPDCALRMSREFEDCEY